MSSRQTEEGLSTALGSTPKVNFDRAFNCTVTIAGTGLGFITLEDVRGAIISQHPVTGNGNFDQMYIHEMRAYGSAGGYLSMAPYPHRQMAGFRTEAQTNGAPLFNTYNTTGQSTDFDGGTLCQLYEFGISGSTRPHLKWTYPKAEILNNPFIVNNISVEALTDTGQPTGTALFLFPNTTTKVLRIQSTNTGGNALYLVQIDVTVRVSTFIQIAPTLGGAAFGEDNVITNNYKPSNDPVKRIEEGKKAEEIANKKRKVKNVRSLTLPPLDSK